MGTNVTRTTQQFGRNPVPGKQEEDEQDNRSESEEEEEIDPADHVLIDQDLVFKVAMTREF